MSKQKKLFLSVHCVLTLLLIAPFFFGLYSTAITGNFYSEPQVMSAIILLAIAIVLNVGLIQAFHYGVISFLGDDE